VGGSLRITAELSLYPLKDDYLPDIEVFIEGLESRHELEIRVNQMSTQIRGELQDVFRALEDLTRESFAQRGPQALVAKILNADLPIAERPELGKGQPRSL
jgi:uncharacterized protein YqgV (UPF0045/DUF77 family)